MADVATGARFLWSLPAFLRHPISVEQARAILRRRLEERETDFLALMQWGVYQPAAGPYRKLLRLAGCEYGDLERLVCQEGVEGALHGLYRRGVYLTLDEFKGRRPVVRGSATLAVDPARLTNPRSAIHYRSRSGGSRGRGTVVPIDLASVRERAVNRLLTLEASGGSGWLHAIWTVPGGGSIGPVLSLCAMGTAPARWFSQLDPVEVTLHPRYRWSARALRWGALLAGAALPRPEHVSPEDPLPIAYWMADVLRTGRTPHLLTYPSAAVRLCQVASAAGVDLGGAQFTVGGEPMTAARLAAIRQVGARAVPGYGSAECDLIGRGCLAPDFPDDHHLFDDVHALIQPGAAPENFDLPPSALLISSLRPTAPLILLNVSLGDQAVIARRACGCPMERHGWATHLHTIRSYEKLTAGGMTFSDTDVVRVLEVVLPARFGGRPTHYQLVEEEAADGRPRLRLLVHPAVGPLDDDAVAATFLAAIGSGSGAERVMALQWGEAGLLRVERQAPRATATGKILHLHQDPRLAGESAAPLRV